MKKLFTFIVGAVVGLGAYAQDFDSGGLYYSVLSPDDKTCAVTGFYEVGSELVIPETVSYEGEDYTVTEISPWSIRDLSFTSLTLPSTLETIGDGAFYNCYELRDLVIPDAVKNIGGYGFAYCGKVRKAVLGSSLEVIGWGAFEGCWDLNVVEPLGQTPAKLDADFKGTFTNNPLVAVREDLVSAYAAAWTGANVVPNIPAETLEFIPERYTVQPGGSVQLYWETVPANAPVKFSSWNSDILTVDSNGLATADNLKGGYTVGVTATTLNGLSAICYIEIESLSQFESNGFVYAVIPNSDNEVAVIRYDSPDTAVNIPETVEYDGNVYDVTTIGPTAFNWNGSIEEVTIPASVKLIREYNFSYCSSLKKVTIADATTPLTLSNNNITDNNSLSEVYVGRNLTYSEDIYCFHWNYALSHIVLGTEVTSLPDYIFRGCDNLNLVESWNPVPPVLGEDAFGYRNLTIIVPASSVEAYRAAWEQYASNIIDTVDADSLSFETSEVTIYNGQSIKLPLTVEPEGATVLWTSSNPDLVSVDAEGNVSYYVWMNGVGEAVITASSINGLTAECTVTAKHWLTFPEDKVSMILDETYQVEVTKPEEIAESPITWTSSDETVATVDENGLITAVGPGDAEITAHVKVAITEYWAPAFDYSIDVEVRKVITAVTPVEPVITVWKDNEARIELLFEPNDQYIDREMTWTVANPEIAEVFQNWDNTYYVRGLEGGQTTITGVTTNGIEVNIDVVVKAWVEQVIFSKNGLYLTPGESTELEFTTVPETTNLTFHYSSDEDNVATVDEDGVVTAQNYGNTRVFVWAESPWGDYVQIGSQEVHVGIMPESVRFVGSTDYEGSLTYWTGFQLEFTPDDPNVFKKIDWTADDPEIVFIDTDNTFKGLKFGSTAFRGVAINGDVLEGTITIAGLEMLVDGQNVWRIEGNVGDEYNLEINASSDELLANLSLVTDDPSVATVDENGLLTAVGCGTTYVRAESWMDVNGERKDYSVAKEIMVRPESGIVFNKSAVAMSVNNGWAYLSLISAADVYMWNVNWSSSDESVVRINWSNDYQAELQYVGIGYATITATDQNGNVATCNVTCYGLEIVPSYFEMYDNSTYQLTARLLPEGESITEPIYWSASEPWMLEVDNTGLVTSYDNSGYSWINAETTVNGLYLYASSEVNIMRRILVSEIVLNETSILAEEGTSVQLIATIYPEDATFQDLRWESSDESVAVVDRNGLVTIISDGNAVITAMATDGSGVTATCLVEKMPIKVERITLSETEWVGSEGSSFVLIATVYPYDAADQRIIWSSSNPDVASVDAYGTVTTHKAGSAVITATAADRSGVTAHCDVTVLLSQYPGLPNPATGIELSEVEWEAKVGETLQLEAEVKPWNATNDRVYWSSSDESVATVDYNGVVTAVGVGEAVITAEVYGISNVTAECKVKVTEASASDPNGVAGLDADAIVDVYTQQGILIKHNCTAAELKELQSGIYIIRSGNTVKTVYLRN